MPYMEERTFTDRHRFSLADCPADRTTTTNPFPTSSQWTLETSSVSWTQDAQNTHMGEGEPAAHSYPQEPHLFATRGRVPSSPYEHVNTTTEQNRGFTDTSASRRPSSIPRTCSGLPAQIWREIFAYLPPKSLGQLLLVNRAFHNYLDVPVKAQTSDLEDHVRNGHVLAAEKVWTQSRRLYHHHLPRPLIGHTELQMWRLIGSKACQYCPVQKNISHLQEGVATGRLTPRLQLQGVRIHWPLAIRTCNSCLKRETFTEAELVAQGLSFLLSALTSTVISDTPSRGSSPLLSTRNPLPISLGCKRYLKVEVESMRDRTNTVSQAFGSATAEEWLNNLGSSAGKRQKDAERWQNWEKNGGAKKLLLPTTLPLRSHSKGEPIENRQEKRQQWRNNHRNQTPPQHEAKPSQYDTFAQSASPPPHHLDVLRVLPHLNIQSNEYQRGVGINPDQISVPIRAMPYELNVKEVVRTQPRASPRSMYQDSITRAQRSRSRSPVRNRPHSATNYRERKAETMYAPYCDPNSSKYAVPRGGTDTGHFGPVANDNNNPLPPPPPPPARGFSPRALYNQYSTEYVRTSADHNQPYVWSYPSPKHH